MAKARPIQGVAVRRWRIVKRPMSMGPSSRPTKSSVEAQDGEAEHRLARPELPGRQEQERQDGRRQRASAAPGGAARGRANRCDPTMQHGEHAGQARDAQSQADGQLGAAELRAGR